MTKDSRKKKPRPSLGWGFSPKEEFMEGYGKGTTPYMVDRSHYITQEEEKGR